MKLDCVNRGRCYEFYEAVAIAMGDSVDESKNITEAHAKVRIINLLCAKCKNLKTKETNYEHFKKSKKN